MAWTEAQEKAITSRNQNLLLSAAAGSGKTAVLVERIIRRLIDVDNPTDITEIMVVTFTKAAAGEMRERIGGALLKAAEDETLSAAVRESARRQAALLPSARISTFHAFCQYVLRTRFYTIDLDPQFTIAGTEELELLKQSVWDDVALSYYEDEEKVRTMTALTDVFGNDRGDAGLTEIVMKAYEYIRSQPWPLQWLEEATAAYEKVDSSTDLGSLPWASPILANIRSALSRCADEYDESLKILEYVEELNGQYERFKEERNRFKAASEIKSWSRMEDFFSDFDFGRLKSMRNLVADVADAWNDCKAHRDKAKDTVKKIRDTYFTKTSKQWVDDLIQAGHTMSALSGLIRDFYKAYNAAKREKNWLDFGDLEHYCLQILTVHDEQTGEVLPSAAAKEMRSTFKEILIDEYQDTNGVQELITTLVSDGTNRFMVGDIKQSIYRFRLADPTLFLEKYMTFERRAEAVNRCIDLSMNFRSAPAVIEAVNDIFSYAMTEAATGMDYGDNEKLYVGRTDDEPGVAELHILDEVTTYESLETDGGEESDDDDDSAEESSFIRQCRFVAARIGELKAADPSLKYKDIVVLLRSVSRKAEDLLTVLQDAGIPAYAEQKGGYFNVTEVRLMTALLACIDNPCRDIELAAVLRSPIVGINEATLAEIRMYRDGYLVDALEAYTAGLHDGVYKERLSEFLFRLDAWRTYSRRAGVAELLRRIYEKTSYIDYVAAMKNGDLRRANLEALYERAGQYERAGFRGLFRFLKFIERMKKKGLDLAPARVVGEEEDVVRIMTIHKSKGLEFPVVFLVNTEKTFNKQDEQEPVLYHKELGIGIRAFDAKWRMTWPTLAYNGIKERTVWENRAEEERLLYVAMTRAKNRLILVGTVKSRGSKNTDCLYDRLARFRNDVHAEAGTSYLDWILPPLLRKLPDVTDLTASDENSEFVHAGVWQVTVHTEPVDAGKAMADVLRPEEAHLEAVRADMPTGTAIPAWLDEALSFTYPFEAATHTVAKLSVSEIKRRLAEATEEEDLLQEGEHLFSTGVEDDETDLTRPPWLCEKASQSPTFAGTVFHKAVQLLDFADLTKENIVEQVEGWKNSGRFTSEELSRLRMNDLYHFAESHLAARIQASPDVRREYGFTFLADSDKVSRVEGERILVQGVVDCLFVEGDEWIIVDYKTDRLNTADEFKKRYAVQLNLYKLAVEQISQRKVKEMIIYSSRLGKEIFI